MAEAEIARETRECHRCSLPHGRRSRYCSTICRDEVKRRKAGIRSWAERFPNAITVTKICAVCDAAFTRRDKPKDAGRCCSRACGFEYERRRKAALKLVRETIERGARMYARWAKRARPKPEVKAGSPKTCRGCSAVIEKHKQFCPACREVRLARQWEAGKPARRRAKALRKAMERGAHPGAERFDPFDVFRRDGWRCHLCGCRTPERLRGTYEPNAPELDHIVPISAGGQHTRLNTACACRQCNGRKSDKPLGQLLLIA